MLEFQLCCFKIFDFHHKISPSFSKSPLKSWNVDILPKMNLYSYSVLKSCTTFSKFPLSSQNGNIFWQLYSIVVALKLFQRFGEVRGLRDKANRPDAASPEGWKPDRCFPASVSLCQSPSGLRGRITPGVGKTTVRGPYVAGKEMM